jgi:hypothetical protein
MVVVAGLRGNVGYDTCDYKELYATMGALDYEDIWYIEPGFLLVTWISRAICRNPQFFLCVMAAVQGALLYSIARRVRNPHVFLLFFLPVFYYPYFYSMIRQALATLILCFVYASYLRSGSPAYISLLAPTIHLSTLPVLSLIKPIAKWVLFFFVLFLFIFLFKMDSIEGLVIYNYFAKVVNVLSGGYYVEHDVTWHVYLSYALMQIVIILTAGKWKDVIMYSFLITVMMVADIYFFKTGRVANVAITCLCVLHGNNWHLYRPSIKKIILVYYCYLALSMTVYPIVYGAERVQRPFAEQIRTQPGNYHLWLVNDKNLCPY